MSKQAKGLDTCPKCSADSIFLPMNPAAGYDGKLYGSRSEGFCNSPDCDQLLWYYPRSGRVTRRNVGQTLAEYWANQRKQYANFRFLNIMRRTADLAPLREVPDELWRTAAYEPPPLSLVARFRRSVVGWYWYIVAALKSPFLGKLPLPLPLPLVDSESLQARVDLQSADKTINQVREELGLETVQVRTLIKETRESLGGSDEG